MEHRDQNARPLTRNILDASFEGLQTLQNKDDKWKMRLSNTIFSGSLTGRTLSSMGTCDGGRKDRIFIATYKAEYQTGGRGIRAILISLATVIQ